jgi:hypothetical protein
MDAKMPMGDNAHIDEFLAELSPAELRYIATASKKMCDAGDMKEDMAEGEMPEGEMKSKEDDTYEFED